MVMGTSTTRRNFLKASAAGVTCAVAGGGYAQEKDAPADLILTNGRIATLDKRKPAASAVAMKGGRFIAVGDDKDVLTHRGDKTQVVDLQEANRHPRFERLPSAPDPRRPQLQPGAALGRRAIAGRCFADAPRAGAANTSATVGPRGRRLERVPVQGAADADPGRDQRGRPRHAGVRPAPLRPGVAQQGGARAVGYTKDTPEPPGGEIQRDKQGNPTGLLIARPNAKILYDTLAKGPKLAPEDQVNSTRLFMREMNRFGITSCIDAGGGYQNYPDDYKVISDLAKAGQLTVRIAYNLFTQRPKQEKEDFAKWVKMAKPGEGDAFYRMNGAGEMLVYSAADFEDFLEPRPDLPKTMEAELTEVVTILAKNRWPFRLHATYDETIARSLDVFEAVNREVPFNGLRWFFDHAETISEKSIERVKALGGGIAVQHRMAFQGEYFIDRYGKKAAEHSPPISRMLKMEVPVGAGTDGTRVASYNPWVSLYWLVSGKTVGGTPLYPRRTGSTGRKPCGATPSAARGSPARRTRRGPSKSASWQTSPCCRPTTSKFPKRRSSGSSRS